MAGPQWLPGARLRWFVEYGCRDDFGSSLGETSAWAGIHYFAARLRGDSVTEEAAPFLTWPEGNTRLVACLARAAEGRIATGALVFDVVPAAGGVTIRYFDAARDEVVAVEAAHAVFAMPRYTAGRLLAPWRDAPPAHLAAFSYVPWLVANLTLRDRPRSSGYPLSWDNVLYDSVSLGYVVATHQKGSDHGPTVLTYYRPFAGEGARKRARPAPRRVGGRPLRRRPRRPHPGAPRPAVPGPPDRRLSLGARDGAPVTRAHLAPGPGAAAIPWGASASRTPTPPGCRSSKRRRTPASRAAEVISLRRRAVHVVLVALREVRRQSSPSGPGRSVSRDGRLPTTCLPNARLKTGAPSAS
ncbi:MAG: hypothetical protein IPP07_14070 [Holophagales bacterium]|nr:hypothetical protein [Holophagales bacterium]